MKRIYFGMLTLFSLVTASVTLAETEVNNPGNSHELEFTSLGMKSLEVMKYYKDEFQDVNFELYKGALTAKVSMEVNPFAQEVNPPDARNYPARNLIVVDVEKWKKMNQHHKISLALHEYLGLIGLEEGAYQISARFLNVVIAGGIDSAYGKWACSTQCEFYVECNAFEKRRAHAGLAGAQKSCKKENGMYRRTEFVFSEGNTKMRALQNLNKACGTRYHGRKKLFYKLQTFRADRLDDFASWKDFVLTDIDLVCKKNI